MDSMQVNWIDGLQNSFDDDNGFIHFKWNTKFFKQHIQLWEPWTQILNGVIMFFPVGSLWFFINFIIIQWFGKEKRLNNNQIIIIR